MPGLDDEALHHPVEGRAVVDAELGQPQEVADVFRRLVGREADGDVAERGLEHGAVTAPAPRPARSRTAAARSAGLSRMTTPVTATGSAGTPLASAAPSRDALRHRRPSLTRPKTVCWPSSARLVDDADEELRAAAVGPARHDHRRHGAARVLLGEALAGHEVQAAGAGLAARRRVLRQRIAALHDALAHDAVEGRAGEAALLRAVLMKSPTWLGACSGSRSITISPSAVVSTACLPRISSSVSGVVNGAGVAGMAGLGAGSRPRRRLRDERPPAPSVRSAVPDRVRASPVLRARIVARTPGPPARPR